MCKNGPKSRIVFLKRMTVLLIHDVSIGVLTDFFFVLPVTRAIDMQNGERGRSWLKYKRLKRLERTQKRKKARIIIIRREKAKENFKVNTTVYHLVIQL